MATKVKNHRLDKPADNTVYGPSWSGVTDQAPSKDAVYNKIESIVGGVIPQYGNFPILSLPTQRTINSNTTYTTVKSFTVTKKGTYKLSFDIASLSTYDMMLRVLINGNEVYETQYQHTSNRTTRDTPITVELGDNVEIQIKVVSAGEAHVKNVLLSCAYGENVSVYVD